MDTGSNTVNNIFLFKKVSLIITEGTRGQLIFAGLAPRYPSSIPDSEIQCQKLLNETSSLLQTAPEKVLCVWSKL